MILEPQLGPDPTFDIFAISNRRKTYLDFLLDTFPFNAQKLAAHSSQWIFSRRGQNLEKCQLVEKIPKTFVLKFQSISHEIIEKFLIFNFAYSSSNRQGSLVFYLGGRIFLLAFYSYFHAQPPPLIREGKSSTLMLLGSQFILVSLIWSLKTPSIWVNKIVSSSKMKILLTVTSSDFSKPWYPFLSWEV